MARGGGRGLVGPRGGARGVVGASGGAQGPVAAGPTGGAGHDFAQMQFGNIYIYIYIYILEPRARFARA